jgi:hypothetical protein
VLKRRAAKSHYALMPDRTSVKAVAAIVLGIVTGVAAGLWINTIGARGLTRQPAIHMNALRNSIDASVSSKNVAASTSEGTNSAPEQR